MPYRLQRLNLLQEKGEGCTVFAPPASAMARRGREISGNLCSTSRPWEDKRARILQWSETPVCRMRADQIRRA